MKPRNTNHIEWLEGNQGAYQNRRHLPNDVVIICWMGTPMLILNVKEAVISRYMILETIGEVCKNGGIHPLQLAAD